MEYTHHQLMTHNKGHKLITKLARDNDFDAVETLWATPAYQGDIIFGLALAGKSELVNELISQVPDPSRLTCIAAIGYAEGGFEDYLDSIEGLESTQLQKAVMLGYAKGGHKHLFQYQLHHDFNTYGTVVLKGLVSGGHIRLLKEKYEFLLSKHLDIAIEVAAEAGQVFFVKELLRRSDGNSKSLGCALTGFSRGRCFEELEPLLQQGLDPMLMLTTLANGLSLEASDISALLASITNDDLRQQISHRLTNHFGIEEADLATIQMTYS